MTQRRVSIKDVAREAGVSVTTVSHALNGKGRLHPETRAHVQRVADRLGYRPNPAARSLVSGKTRLVAGVASLPDDPRIEYSLFGYYSELIGAATATAIDRDYALVVAPPTRAGFIWDRVALDGVIVIDPIAGDRALPSLREREIPFVTVGEDPDGGHQDAVVTADEWAGTMAVLEHLAAGDATVGLLSIPPVNGFARATAAGYRSWCEEEGRVAHAEILDLTTLVTDAESALTAALERLLAAGVDAIYAPVEVVGVQVFHLLGTLGRTVPGDVTLATTHDAGRAAAAAVPLTTLTFDYAEMGRRAADLLLDTIEGSRRGPAREVVPAWVTPRASTDRGVVG